jgi:hypothetical protein
MLPKATFKEREFRGSTLYPLLKMVRVKVKVKVRLSLGLIN